MSSTYDKWLTNAPIDNRSDSEIEQDAAERAEASRIKVELIRDDAAWAKVALRREEAEQVKRNEATVAAMKANPLFAVLFDPAKWQELI